MAKATIIGGASTQYLIYGLIDPRDNQMRYVGATKNIYKRLSRHMAGNKSNVDRVSWLESLKSENLVPSVFDIDEVDEREWEEAERFWIEYYQHLGMPLLNRATGGRTGTRMSKSARKALSESTKRRYENPEEREKTRLSQPQLGKPLSKEHKRRLSQSLKGRTVWNKGISMSNEQKEKLSQSTKRAWVDGRLGQKNLDMLKRRWK